MAINKFDKAIFVAFTILATSAISTQIQINRIIQNQDYIQQQKQQTLQAREISDIYKYQKKTKDYNLGKQQSKLICNYFYQTFKKQPTNTELDKQCIKYISSKEIN